MRVKKKERERKREVGGEAVGKRVQSWNSRAKRRGEYEKGFVKLTGNNGETCKKTRHSGGKPSEMFRRMLTALAMLK